MTAERLRVAVIGAGYGQVHLEHFAARRDVDLVAVWSRTRESAKKAGLPYGVGICTDSIDRIFELDLDAVAVATPVSLIHDVTLRAIERRWHVLAEKPLGLTAQEAVHLLDAAQAADVVHMTNFDWRAIPDAQRLHDLATDGTIGEIRRARLCWLSGTAARSSAWSWKYDRQSAAFGALRAFHHVLDEIHWHLGPVARVVADFQTYTSARPDPVTGELRAADVEDAVAFVAHTATGVYISGELDRDVPGTFVRSTELVGDSGVVRLVFPNHHDRSTTSLIVNRRDEEPREVGERRLPTRTTQDEFVAAIRDRTAAVSTPFAAGVAALMLAEAMRESSETKRWIDLPSNYFSLFDSRTGGG